MNPSNLLIANRGEIAIRVMRAAAELGMRTTAVYSDDDIHSLHTRKADHSIAIKGAGAKAYLDAERIIAIAKESGCDAIHPGYGFLSENAAFARRSPRAVRRQGAGPRHRHAMRHRGDAVNFGRHQPRRRKNLLQVLRHRL